MTGDVIGHVGKAAINVAVHHILKKITRIIVGIGISTNSEMVHPELDKPLAHTVFAKDRLMKKGQLVMGMRLELLSQCLFLASPLTR